MSVDKEIVDDQVIKIHVQSEGIPLMRENPAFVWREYW